ncbi:endonuclease/exonuclease/phosphatase family protein [Aldersonia sp. NBC_00410]|uniref:endonuclease/exonuclease/phosphatase family protein n=1 Tax=Aldersonia sp. NBC_00410 TaxID=2975954 RepID=UPI00224D83A1|nr:endonuclease/exonuclease/phosphatase family protein [Aldersonia sp. NBC_00410]MCX5046274.1 endonuclease/exonuclease/phosphatase family protein [Aldersonia sp. NBC_00410]
MRFLTWNIQSGGGKRIPAIVRELELLSPDFVALTEVTYSNLASLRQSLAANGYHHIETTCIEGRANSVLVASKLSFDVMNEDIGNDQERWLSVRIDSLDLNVLSVHIPGATDDKFGPDGYGLSGERRKQNFWDEVIRYAQAHKGEKTVLLGDFNTGLKEDAQGTPFKLSDNIRILRLEKYVDTWRHLNPKAREYTWYSKQKKEDYNGFRLDYVFVSTSLRESINNAEHIHHVREEKLSDHAMVFTDLSIEP